MQFDTGLVQWVDDCLPLSAVLADYENDIRNFFRAHSADPVNIIICMRPSLYTIRNFFRAHSADPVNIIICMRPSLYTYVHTVQQACIYAYMHVSQRYMYKIYNHICIYAHSLLHACMHACMLSQRLRFKENTHT